MAQTNMSLLFTAFNRAKAHDIFEPARLRRALGYLQRKDQSWREKYATTLDHCECGDAQWRPEYVCKHRLALMLESEIHRKIRANEEEVRRLIQEFLSE